MSPLTGRPGQAEIPMARTIERQDAGVGGPEGRSRMEEVGAA
jgi:hypothetical protein